MHGRVTVARASSLADSLYVVPHSPRNDRRPVGIGAVRQATSWARALWFIFVGWWLGAIWMTVAYILCLLILTMPIGIMMFDRVGGVMTLLRY